MTLFSEKFVVPCIDDKGRKARISLTRYSKSTSTLSEGTILFFHHGNGGHKEQWVPMLEPLLASDKLNIAEAWCMDIYNHGDSLPYNKDLVLATPESSDLNMCWQHLTAVFKSGIISWQNRELVLIGHSVGCHPIVTCTKNYLNRGEEIPFSTAIFFAPVFLPAEVVLQVIGRLRKPTAARKWQWGSRDEAEQAVKRTFPWKLWDKKTQEAYVEYGMVHTVEGSQLKTPMWIEAHGYPRPDQGLSKEDNPNVSSAHDGWLYLQDACKHINVHFVCGDRHDLIPEKFEVQLISTTKDLVKSVHRVPNAGHLVIHEKPGDCAKAVELILSRGSTDLKSQL